MQRLLEGHARFRAEVFPKHAGLFRKLEDQQKPSTLFLTCSDSRVVPDLILQSGPGDLFICRNAGNIVPPYGDGTGGVSATIEYAVMALGIENIIVCGHSDCGAMKAVLSGKKHDSMPAVDTWLKHSTAAVKMLDLEDANPPAKEAGPSRMTQIDDQGAGRRKDLLRALTRANVITQLNHLQMHPSVASALARGKVRLYGWVYEIPTGEIQSFDAEQAKFVPLSTTIATSVNPQRLNLMAG